MDKEHFELPLSKELQDLFDAMKSAREKMTENAVLAKLEVGKLTPEQWKEFAIQRYLAALNFEKLLAAGVRQAKDNGDALLAETLQSNLNDETGTVEGKVEPKLAHTNWRKDFYAALGVSAEELKFAAPRVGTRAYVTELEHLSDDTKLKIVGALLVLEYTIPHEFKRIQTGRDASFPGAFVVQPLDTAEIREQKERARLYIDDHIAHDARSHYPDLLKALQPHLSMPANLAEVKEGIQRIAEAKRLFYADLEKIL